MVGAEHVDRAVEAALQLVDEIRDVGGAIRRRAALVLGADQHPILLVAVGRRARPERAVLLVGVELRQEIRRGVARARSAAPSCRSGCGTAPSCARSTRASSAPGRPPPGRAPRRRRRGSRPRGPARRAERGDRRAEAVHLGAGVVVVVLARDLVAAELEQAGDAVAVGAVARVRDDESGRSGSPRPSPPGPARPGRPSRRRIPARSPRAPRGRTRRRPGC